MLSIKLDLYSFTLGTRCSFLPIHPLCSSLPWLNLLDDFKWRKQTPCSNSYVLRGNDIASAGRKISVLYAWCNTRVNVKEGLFQNQTNDVVCLFFFSFCITHRAERDIFSIPRMWTAAFHCYKINNCFIWGSLLFSRLHIEQKWVLMLNVFFFWQFK